MIKSPELDAVHRVLISSFIYSKMGWASELVSDIKSLTLLLEAISQ